MDVLGVDAGDRRQAVAAPRRPLRGDLVRRRASRQVPRRRRHVRRARGGARSADLRPRPREVGSLVLARRRGHRVDPRPSSGPSTSRGAPSGKSPRRRAGRRSRSSSSPTAPRHRAARRRKQAAEYARKRGVPVSTVAIGTQQGVVERKLPGGYTERIQVPADETALQRRSRARAAARSSGPPAPRS